LHAAYGRAQLEGGNMRMGRTWKPVQTATVMVVEKGTDDERQCPKCGGSGFVPDDDGGHEEVIKTSIE
jgi:hypothetical protein